MQHQSSIEAAGEFDQVEFKDLVRERMRELKFIELQVQPPFRKLRGKNETACSKRTCRTDLDNSLAQGRDKDVKRGQADCRRAAIRGNQTRVNRKASIVCSPAGKDSAPNAWIG
jgi:hypothetical protein